MVDSLSSRGVTRGLAAGALALIKPPSCRAGGRTRRTLRQYAAARRAAPCDGGR